MIPKLTTRPDTYGLQDNKSRAIVIFIDHYDDAENEFSKGELGLAALADVGKGKNIHIVLSGTTGITRTTGDELRRRVEGSRYALVMNDYETVRYMGVRTYFQITKELPLGRGFLVKAVSAALVQTATPVIEGKNGQTTEQQLDDLLGRIREHYTTKAQWSYFGNDLAVLDAAIKGAEDLSNVTTTSGTPAPSPEESEALASLAELLKAQTTLAQEAAAEIIPEARPEDMVSREFPDAEPGENGASGNGKDGHEPEAVAEGAGGKKGKKK